MTTKFWVYDPNQKQAVGPFTPQQMKGIKGFALETLVAPDGAADAAAWKPANTYDELRALFFKPPPLPMPNLPPPVKAASTPKTPSTLVECPGCGKGVYRDAPNCPACGTPIPSRISAKRIGIALAIVFGLPLLFLVLAALLTPSPNDPIAPTAHVQGGLAKQGQGDAAIHKAPTPRAAPPPSRDIPYTVEVEDGQGFGGKFLAVKDLKIEHDRITATITNSYDSYQMPALLAAVTVGVFITKDGVGGQKDFWLGCDQDVKVPNHGSAKFEFIPARKDSIVPENISKARVKVLQLYKNYATGESVLE